MPRPSTLEFPGCPPLRALTTDVLGLVKVVESRAKVEIPKVVDTWGPPDASRGILAASFSDHHTQPLLALARNDNSIEVLNPLNGQALLTTKVAESSSEEQTCEDPVVALHFLNSRRTDTPSKLNVILTCTEKGKSCLRSFALGDSSTIDSQSTWDVCKAGKIICSSVNAKDTHALFGGKRIELNLWDLDNCSKTWTSKPPPSNSLGIFSPTWFTAATFLSKEDHHKIVAGTNNYQVRLYDASAQRRPVITINFRESPIKAVTPDLDGNRIYAGTAIGDLASFDIRTGKLLGCFIGKSCGSIRSIARHAELPLIASCGLDRYLRIWNTDSRRLLSAVFLKQHLTNVMFDSHANAGNSDEQTSDVLNANQIEEAKMSRDDDNTDNNEEEEDERWISSLNEEVEKEKQKKLKKERKKAAKQNKVMKEADNSGLGEDDTEQFSGLKRRKASSKSKKSHSKKLKKSKSKGESATG